MPEVQTNRVWDILLCSAEQSSGKDRISKGEIRLTDIYAYIQFSITVEKFIT